MSKIWFSQTLTNALPINHISTVQQRTRYTTEMCWVRTRNCYSKGSRAPSQIWIDVEMEHGQGKWPAPKNWPAHLSTSYRHVYVHCTTRYIQFSRKGNKKQRNYSDATLPSYPRLNLPACPYSHRAHIPNGANQQIFMGMLGSNSLSFRAL